MLWFSFILGLACITSFKIVFACDRGFAAKLPFSISKHLLHILHTSPQLLCQNVPHLNDPAGYTGYPWSSFIFLFLFYFSSYLTIHKNKGKLEIKPRMKLNHIACTKENVFIFMSLVHEVKSNKREYFLVTIGRHQQKQHQLNDLNKNLNCSLSFG